MQAGNCNDPFRERLGIFVRFITTVGCGIVTAILSIWLTRCDLFGPAFLSVVTDDQNRSKTCDPKKSLRAEEGESDEVNGITA